MDPKVKKSPKSFVKTLAAPYDVKAFHICDYESNDDQHVMQFKNILTEIKEANSLKRKMVYSLGYSNYAFELWIILHKIQYLGSLPHRRNYLRGINDAYNENFQFLADYKEEENFKRILSRINLNDVKVAINNASYIRVNRMRNSERMHEFAGFYYYNDNPDLTINECVKEILQECGIIQ